MAAPPSGASTDWRFPYSVNTRHNGRAVPDVAANASTYSGYTGITVNGKAFTGNGTSASAPLWAGPIAVLNTNLKARLGFINPLLYQIGSAGFNDITGAATGWGSPHGRALLHAMAKWTDWTDPLPGSPWRFDHTRQHLAVVSRAPASWTCSSSATTTSCSVPPG